MENQNMNSLNTDLKYLKSKVNEKNKDPPIQLNSLQTLNQNKFSAHNFIAENTLSNNTLEKNTV